MSPWKRGRRKRAAAAEAAAVSVWMADVVATIDARKDPVDIDGVIDLDADTRKAPVTPSRQRPLRATRAGRR